MSYQQFASMGSDPIDADPIDAQKWRMHHDKYN